MRNSPSRFSRRAASAFGRFSLTPVMTASGVRNSCETLSSSAWWSFSDSTRMRSRSAGGAEVVALDDKRELPRKRLDQITLREGERLFGPHPETPTALSSLSNGT